VRTRFNTKPFLLGDNMKDLTIFDRKVSQDAEGRLSLNDLYHLAGDESKRDPRRWTSEAGKSFIEHVSQNVQNMDILKSKRGKGGGTFAHWQIALAYAKYLSHDLHEQVNKVYAGYVTASPEMAADMVDRMDSDGAKWVEARAQGRQQRLVFTDTLKDHGVSQGWQFGACTNAIYQPILGGKAKDVKAKRGLPARANLRDAMSLKEVMAAGLAEALATESISNKDSQGFNDCKVECEEAAKKVKSIL
jgi:hypothetical protein